MPRGAEKEARRVQGEYDNWQKAKKPTTPSEARMTAGRVMNPHVAIDITQPENIQPEDLSFQISRSSKRKASLAFKLLMLLFVVRTVGNVAVNRRINREEQKGRSLDDPRFEANKEPIPPFNLKPQKEIPKPKKVSSKAISAGPRKKIHFSEYFADQKGDSVFVKGIEGSIKVKIHDETYRAKAFSGALTQLNGYIAKKVGLNEGIPEVELIESIIGSKDGKKVKILGHMRQELPPEFMVIGYENQKHADGLIKRNPKVKIAFAKAYLLGLSDINFGDNIFFNKITGELAFPDVERYDNPASIFTERDSIIKYDVKYPEIKELYEFTKSEEYQDLKKLRLEFFKQNSPNGEDSKEYKEQSVSFTENESMLKTVVKAVESGDYSEEKIMRILKIDKIDEVRRKYSSLKSADREMLDGAARGEVKLVDPLEIKLNKDGEFTLITRIDDGNSGSRKEGLEGEEIKTKEIKISDSSCPFFYKKSIFELKIPSLKPKPRDFDKLEKSQEKSRT